MRIALVGQKGIPCTQGGIERYTEELATRLVRCGHEVIVYTRPYYTPKQLKEFKGVRLVSLPSLQTKHLDAISHSLLASLHAVFVAKVDIVHYMNIGPALVSWIPKLFSRTTKVVSTFQCMDWNHQKWGFLAKFSLKLGCRAMIKFSDSTFTVSQEIRDYVEENYGQRMPVISNGVTIKERLSPGDLKTELQRFGLQPGAYILSASRLVKHKGVHYLIDAFKQLSPPQDMKLVIAGEGFHTDDYVDYLKWLSTSRADIFFIGQIAGQTLQALFEGAAVFVLSSEAEGFSLVLLEAMGYGAPVVVSNIKPNLESVRVGHTLYAEVFKNTHIGDLRDKLVAVLSWSDREREERVKLARNHVATNFDWQSIADKIINIYNTEKG